PPPLPCRSDSDRGRPRRPRCRGGASALHDRSPVSGPWLRSVELVRVLVVDDQRLVPDPIRGVRAALCMVEVAACGLEALALVRAGRRYVAILCDVMMPT